VFASIVASMVLSTSARGDATEVSGRARPTLALVIR
jgi:hypothetical protein